MDWQQPTALLIVAVTAFIMLKSKFLPRKRRFDEVTACGCTGNAADNRGKSISLRGRKGERPQVVVKM